MDGGWRMTNRMKIDSGPRKECCDSFLLPHLKDNFKHGFTELKFSLYQIKTSGTVSR